MEGQESEDETGQSCPPSTSTPKKHGEVPTSHEHVEISPVKLFTTSQQTQASQEEEFDVDSYINFLHEGETPECSQRSAGSSWQDEYTQCDICQVCGRIAYHLRRSKECLMQLKSQPQFQFQGSNEDEVFIVKMALMIGECPSSCCTTGRHSEIPQDCIEWWKSEGWNIMGWRGESGIADAQIIKERIRNFVKNQRKKKTPRGQPQSGTKVSQSLTDGGDRYRCRSCGCDRDLIQHLFENFPCLEAYIQHFLVAAEDEVDVRKSIFQLSIVLNMCARVECEQKNDFTYLGSHLNRSEECLAFYQNEGVELGIPKWNPEASGRIISNKIAQMRRTMNEKKREEQSYGCVSFREELSRILNYACCRCGTLGPVAGEEQFVMRGGWTDANGDPAWFCSKCSENSPEWETVRQKLSDDVERLKGPNDSQECDLKAVESQILHRLTLAPACLTENNADIPQLSLSLSTLVLVPNHPSAIRGIKNWCDNVVKEKSELKRCTEEILKRPILTNFEQTLSCLYRSLLADMRSKMKEISIALSKSSRGEVLSRTPNITSATKRTPNIEMTIDGALKSLCNWSSQHEKQRSMESEARSHINGRVKVYVRGTILENLEDEDLKRILLLGYRSFVDGEVTSFEELEGVQGLQAFIIRMTPVILKYVRSKVKLFIKNIIAPNYSNYDLRLEIDDERLIVQIHGYVYAKQFNNVNKMLAENPQQKWSPEVTDRVTAEEEILPTTSLNWRCLSDVYKIDEFRAKDIVEVAQSCQMGNIAFPLSLLNIWTPGGWSPSEKEKVLRNRVEQLSNERANDENIIEAIIDITIRLQEEGLFEELVTEEIDRDTLRNMKIRFSDMCPDDPMSANALMWYHTLLLRTGGSNQWTLRRHCGESCVIPYSPLFLEALRGHVEVRIAMDPEHIEAKGVCHGASPHEGIMAGYAWKEISILKFLDGVSRDKFEEPVSQAIVTVITSQEDEVNFKDSDEKDEECDEVFTNSKKETFIISNGDLRKLYAKRPPAMELMTFAEFVISYYRKTSRQQAIIDPNSGIGEESGQLIVGGGNLRAPVSMKLSNTIIMKRRSVKSMPVPLLLRNNTLDSYGERMLFQPWRTVEELVQNQEEEDKEQQKQNRLKIFPMSIFPTHVDE